LEKNQKTSFFWISMIWYAWWKYYALLSKSLTSRYALSEGIASQIGKTWTNRIVIDYSTLRSDTTCSAAGVYALLIITGHISGTVGADNAFSSAIRWRIQVSRYTRADGLFVYLSAHTVRSARCWDAWIFRYRYCINIIKYIIIGESTISL